MNWSELAQTVFMSIYTFSLLMVCVYGFHRYALVYLYYRHRHKLPRAKGEFAELPDVTVQLPMYNESRVARRIIEAACGLDYPRNKLHIQVLDDSTDQTCQIARAACQAAREKGFDIEYIHRDKREGYKAGALANGLNTAKGEFIAIFDADFLPEPSFLKRSIHHFTDPRVGVVQTRWAHINRHESLLTRSQAILLDGHFAIEHVARNRSERFMSFNGTAGTWRRSAIADAGGWRHDTLTEDLDLSYRAQLRGWRFVFLPDLTAPAELPPEMNGFKAQQFRWTKGGAQTAIKLLPKVLLSRAPLKVKIESIFHLTEFTVHLYVIILILSMFPAIYLKTVPVDAGSAWRGVFDMTVFTLATLSATTMFFAGQFELFGDWRSVIKYMPVLMALGVGLSVSNSKAVVEALIGKRSKFVRTPKYGQRVKQIQAVPAVRAAKVRREVLPWVEFAMGIYMTVCAICSMIHYRSLLAAPFLVIFACGFYYVSITSMLARRMEARCELAEAGAEAGE